LKDNNKKERDSQSAARISNPSFNRYVCHVKLCQNILIVFSYLRRENEDR
jgi:hypothetical protein